MRGPKTSIRPTCNGAEMIEFGGVVPIKSIDENILHPDFLRSLRADRCLSTHAGSGDPYVTGELFVKITSTTRIFAETAIACNTSAYTLSYRDWELYSFNSLTIRTSALS